MTTASSPKVRMGMVGGGEGAFIGAVHRCAAALDGKIELVCGAFSRDTDNNQRTGSGLGLANDRIYDSWQSLLQQEAQRPAEERMEVLAIVTPNHLHAPIAQAALDAGFHVFSEKPAGTSLAEVREINDTLQTRGLLYGLAHTYLGYPMVWQAREMVREGVLGAVRKIYVEYPQGWMTEAQEEQGNKQATWRSDPALAGASGCMADIGTHAFGMAEFISGHAVATLCADLATHIPGRRLDDDGAALFRTHEGASGVLMASQVCAGEENALKVRVYGEKGGLEWHQMEPNSLVYRPLGEPMRVLRAGVDQPGLSKAALERCRLPGGHPEGYIEAMANLYRDFAIAVRAGEAKVTASGVPGIEAGMRGMAFIEAMVQSHGSDTKWVQIPDVG
jgi:predicted dehydrogenase